MNNTMKVVFTLLILIFSATLVSAQTIDVGGGSQYQRIQDAMNSAVSGDIVYVHPGTYEIGEDEIQLKSNVNLIGAGYDSTIIHGGSTSGGVASSKIVGGWIEGEGVTNVEISGFKFTSTARSPADGGHGESRNCIRLHESSNIRIHDMYAQRYLYNDMVDCRGGDNIQIYNCISKSVGHDFVEFLSDTKNSKVYNCLIDVQTNTGVRFDGATNCEVSYCTIYDDTGSGWNALEMESRLTNCRIDHCIVRNMHGSTGNNAIQPVGFSGSLSVTNCVMWDCAGYIALSATTSNNLLGDAVSPKEESYWVSKGYGYGASGAPTMPDVTNNDPNTNTNTNTNNSVINNDYSNSLDYASLKDVNVPELDLTATTVNSVGAGTGKYQNVLLFSVATVNGVDTSNSKQSVFWVFPDNLMANLYGSSVMGYKPSASVQFSPTVKDNIIVPLTTSSTTPTTSTGTPTATGTTTAIVSPTGTTTVTTTTTTTTTITNNPLQNAQNAIDSLVMIQPKAYN